MNEDDEHIGPYSGHYKSEALPKGCAILVLSIIGFIVIMAAYGFIADWIKNLS